MPRKSKPLAEQRSKPPAGPGGRPRRATISEKEDLEKARNIARQSAVAAMQGYVEQLTAMKTEFYQGVPMCDVIDWSTRQRAQEAILDRAGIVKQLDISISDPLTQLMADIFGEASGAD